MELKHKNKFALSLRPPLQQNQRQWEYFVASYHDGLSGWSVNNAMLAPEIFEKTKVKIKQKYVCYEIMKSQTTRGNQLLLFNQTITSRETKKNANKTTEE